MEVCFELQVHYSIQRVEHGIHKKTGVYSCSLYNTCTVYSKNKSALLASDTFYEHFRSPQAKNPVRNLLLTVPVHTV